MILAMILAVEDGRDRAMRVDSADGFGNEVGDGNNSNFL